ncbi:hypothetical protein B1A_20166, partial [mine drainage metagenome]
MGRDAGQPGRGATYCTRSDNTNAKAGNLNAVLPTLTEEYVAVVDADMVPQPDWLRRVLP